MHHFKIVSLLGLQVGTIRWYTLLSDKEYQWLSAFFRRLRLQCDKLFATFIEMEAAKGDPLRAQSLLEHAIQM